ncbi:hypothetical protein CLCR_00326 [Cladophialophora carrionii]|uniref:Uncharacterized protein n=1 Tax=Cladophialophora carrionii TaxID=86049 RepID=A0A1C1D0J8_9EURO|nr:hypothetical protein CLCR_00326 [Cladophialophora carrionii]
MAILPTPTFLKDAIPLNDCTGYIGIVIPDASQDTGVPKMPTSDQPGAPGSRQFPRTVDGPLAHARYGLAAAGMDHGQDDGDHQRDVPQRNVQQQVDTQHGAVKAGFDVNKFDLEDPQTWPEGFDPDTFNPKAKAGMPHDFDENDPMWKQWLEKAITQFNDRSKKVQAQVAGGGTDSETAKKTDMIQPDGTRVATGG